MTISGYYLYRKSKLICEGFISLFSQLLQKGASICLSSLSSAAGVLPIKSPPQHTVTIKGKLWEPRFHLH